MSNDKKYTAQASSSGSSYHIYTGDELRLIINMLHSKTGYSHKTLSYIILHRSDRYEMIDSLTYRAILNAVKRAYKFTLDEGLIDDWPSAIPKPE